jgi:hypothetical protein
MFQGGMDGFLASGCDELLCPPGMFKTSTADVSIRNHAKNVTTVKARSGAEVLFEELFSTTDGPDLKDKTNWLASDSACSFKGISCESDTTGDLTVTEIDLSSNSLKGYVPSIVFSLPSLRSLNVGENDDAVS